MPTWPWRSVCNLSLYNEASKQVGKVYVLAFASLLHLFSLQVAAALALGRIQCGCSTETRQTEESVRGESGPKRTMGSES